MIPETEQRTARDLMRPAIYVPETISVNALLRQFRHNRQHIAIVLDEYGGTAGLVTLEDLLEEIVGEVQDPFDTTAPEIQIRPDGSVIIQGLSFDRGGQRRAEPRPAGPLFRHHCRLRTRKVGSYSA